MAKVENTDYSKRHGKLNKKDNVIHRMRNGKEHVYSILNPNTAKPSKAQKSNRELFGRINTIVNAVMTDPRQEAEWKARMEEANRAMVPYKPPFPKRFKTTRQYVFAVVREQLERIAAAKSKGAAVPVVLPKGVKLHIGAFADLSAGDIYEILKARYAVFTLEQGIRYPDEDNIDYIATHIALRRNGLVIAYARMFADAEKGVMRVGRMLTTERGKGFGRFLMEQICAEAKRQEAAKLRLHAQLQAAPFYELFGFSRVGEAFTEADIPHICMELKI